MEKKQDFIKIKLSDIFLEDERVFKKIFNEDKKPQPIKKQK